ncbi:MAG: hypothetical protein HOC63_17740 [Rhodospirillales bacterium]|nr:hypothetical protein [Rhodospirillales bacterium]MBT4038652.1 hypothetical protein [Rhodospirillales bacterium]MBT4628522.1 hypothetical protein [Rhodospirillales bacterium]MBT5350451.1 hypothetical protein [Rhodospirillales bacterium]MBT5520339.1 hypothetical protein [Rhodospirillales bacterium]
MTKTRPLILSLATFLMLFGQVTFTNAQENTTQNQSVTVSDQIFTHPEKGFQVLVPGDADFALGEGNMDMAISSRKGWGVNIQSAMANPNTTVEEMIGRLEAGYLGNGKPWTQKLSGGKIMVLGRQGYNGTYEGSGMKVQVLLLRTDAWDFVVMFIAPQEAFLTAQPTFDRILASFKPGNAAAGSTASQSPPQPDVPAATGASGELVRYNDSNLGYSMVYPDNWKISRPNDSTTVFTGVPGSPSAYAAVAVQNVAPAGSSTDKLAVDAVVQDLRAQMAYSLSNVNHVQGQPFVLPSTMGPIQVVQFVSDYRRGQVDFRQWTLAMARPGTADNQGASLIHVWTYIAPSDQFEASRDLAEQMAGSWTVIPVAR